MSLVAMLEDGRRDFLDAARDVSVEQASARPSREAWSVLECMEHVVAVEERYLGWISNGTAIAPQRNTEKESRLFTIIRSRLTKVRAPEVFRPQGRFDPQARLGGKLAPRGRAEGRRLRPSSLGRPSDEGAESSPAGDLVRPRPRPA